MNTNEEYETEIDLLELFHVIIHKLWIIILSGILLATGFGLFTKFCISPKYDATATLYLIDNKNENTINMNDINVANQLSNDYEELAKSRYVLEHTIKNLKLDLQPKELAKMISISNPSDTRFLNIKVTSNDPELSKDIANELTQILMDRVVSIMRIEKPSLSERAVTPLQPSGPNLPKNIILGFLLGCILAGGIIVAVYLLDDTIKDEDDVTKYLNLNTLAMFPEVKGNSGSRSHGHNKK